MKLTITSPVLALLLLNSIATAGNFFGPNPWANGAYYPGQLDGKYSATVFGNNTSGVLGFALRNGSPTTITNSTINTNNSIQNTVQLDPFQNYFLIFFNGITYAGATFGSINVDSKQVTGALFDGRARTSLTNFVFASGGFTATLTSDKSPFTFTGDNSGQLEDSAGVSTFFSLNGIKISDTTDSTVGTAQ
jgi:hypothetical protein